MEHPQPFDQTIPPTREKKLTDHLTIDSMTPYYADIVYLLMDLVFGDDLSHNANELFAPLSYTFEQKEDKKRNLENVTIKFDWLPKVMSIDVMTSEPIFESADSYNGMAVAIGKAFTMLQYKHAEKLASFTYVDEFSVYPILDEMVGNFNVCLEKDIVESLLHFHITETLKNSNLSRTATRFIGSNLVEMSLYQLREKKGPQSDNYRNCVRTINDYSMLNSLFFTTGMARDIIGVLREGSFMTMAPNRYGLVIDDPANLTPCLGSVYAPNEFLNQQMPYGQVPPQQMPHQAPYKMQTMQQPSALTTIRRDLNIKYGYPEDEIPIGAVYMFLADSIDQKWIERDEVRPDDLIVVVNRVEKSISLSSRRTDVLKALLLIHAMRRLAYRNITRHISEQEQAYEEFEQDRKMFGDLF